MRSDDQTSFTKRLNGLRAGAGDGERSVRDVTLSATDLVLRLVALAPPSKGHLTSFHGVYAPHSKLRALVIEAPRAVGAGGNVGVSRSLPQGNLLPQRKLPLLLVAPDLLEHGGLRNRTSTGVLLGAQIWARGYSIASRIHHADPEVSSQLLKFGT